MNELNSGFRGWYCQGKAATYDKSEKRFLWIWSGRNRTDYIRLNSAKLFLRLCHKRRRWREHMSYIKFNLAQIEYHAMFWSIWYVIIFDRLWPSLHVSLEWRKPSVVWKKLKHLEGCHREIDENKSGGVVPSGTSCWNVRRHNKSQHVRPFSQNPPIFPIRSTHIEVSFIAKFYCSLLR